MRLKKKKERKNKTRVREKISVPKQQQETIQKSPSSMNKRTEYKRIFYFSLFVSLPILFLPTFGSATLTYCYLNKFKSTTVKGVNNRPEAKRKKKENERIMMI